MRAALQRISSAAGIPDDWDRIAGSCFQRREFLRHCEIYNPCRQRYYTLSGEGGLKAGACVYSLRLDLLTFLGIVSPVTVQVVGVPCSVSASGIVGGPVPPPGFLESLFRAERGLTVVLNVDGVPDRRGVAVGRTFPDVVLANRFRGWDDYLSSLRSAYRRRLREIEVDSLRYDITTAPCSGFTDDEHRLYLNVLERSACRLERLSADFFRSLPGAFRLTRFTRDGALCGWVITVLDGGRYCFFLGGQGDSPRSESLYHVKLATILKQGIGLGAREIDFGQTAETPKMRLGGLPREKIMLGRHSNPLFHALLRASIGFLSYRAGALTAPRVFKEAAA